MSKDAIVDKYQKIIDTVVPEKDTEVLKNSRANLEILKQQLDNSVLQPILSEEKKLEDKLDYLKKKETITDLSNDIGDKLSQQYDKRFYTNYDIWNNLSNKINTQTSIIKINNKNAVRTDRIITALKSIISSLIIIVFLYILYTLLRKKWILRLGIPFTVLITVMYVSVNYYLSYKETVADQSRVNLKALEKGAVRAFAKNLLPPDVYQCPAECEVDPEKQNKSPLEEPPKFEHTDFNQDYPPNIVGDVPAILGYNPLGPKLADKEKERKYIAFVSNPNNRVPPLIPGILDYKDMASREKSLKTKVLCYTCEWKGPKTKNRRKMIKTHIPCEHYPGYSSKPVKKENITLGECLKK
tara:strand:- start:120 stop:1184 length:1065 start_codon:yes stop_codon:yes gene_type:complete